MPTPSRPPIQWAIARAHTIRRAIARTERRLLLDLEPRERADELARLETLRRLVRMSR